MSNVLCRSSTLVPLGTMTIHFGLSGLSGVWVLSWHIYYGTSFHSKSETIIQTIILFEWWSSCPWVTDVYLSFVGFHFILFNLNIKTFIWKANQKLWQYCWFFYMANCRQMMATTFRMGSMHSALSIYVYWTLTLEGIWACRLSCRNLKFRVGTENINNKVVFLSHQQ